MSLATLLPRGLAKTGLPGDGLKLGKETDMSGDIYMAAAGALATERKLDLIANNLANINTAGFKRDIGQFKYAAPDNPLLLPENYDEIDDLPQVSAYDLAAEALWMEFRTVTDFSSGKYSRTGNTLDVAINGPGFFTIQTPEGLRYTRSGDFTIDAEGVLTTKDGHPVMGTGGEIKLPQRTGQSGPETVGIDSKGGVTVGTTSVGELQIVDFGDLSLLKKMGNSLFAAPEPGPGFVEAQDYSISQGFLELSNVDSVKMMTEMIEVLRGYEAYQKVIQSIDKVNQSAIREVSG
jgi:flagellar basal-body rod protein FlgG